LSGTGTAHAYTDNERNYLFQLGPDMLQVPGSDGDKLQNGYWSATTAGRRPTADSRERAAAARGAVAVLLH